MEASSSTSTYEGANPNNKSYQVFINHRGVDVKETFARSLYLRLLDKRIRVFLDRDEMQPGYKIDEQIEHAIKTASVHVAIFSPRYAESNWCLNELLLMLESKAPIIPIFYGVSPANVRWLQLSYERDLQKLEMSGRYNPDTTEKWRKALQQVADNSGFELHTLNGEELVLELLDKVVTCVSEMVAKMVAKTDLYVSEYPTGLDYKLKDFEDTVLLQKEQNGKPRILGIVGLGGVGKTTMAKEYFNKKKTDYEKSCFLSDIRDHEAHMSLNLLQSQLLNSLTGSQVNINSVDQGKRMLIEPLRSFKVLIILDDVDNVNQVKAFLPVETRDLKSRSLILITSRYRDVIIMSRVEESSIYRLSGLDRQHSGELFCFHAFSQPFPFPEFKSLVNKFLDCCDGLPLSLKVVGALLYNKEMSEWADELEVLREILLDEIHMTISRSYLSLNQQEKDIFLDIACFFINQNRDSAISVWDGSGWRGKRGFQNLQDKSLVEVDGLNSIHMHDHLRDFGRQFAASLSPLRLCGTKNVLDKLSYPSSEMTVRGILMVHGEYSGQDEIFGVVNSENAVLERIFWRLRILYLEGSLLERILSKVKLPNLLWLSWEECPHSSLPSWVPVKNLRCLHVFNSDLKTLWHREGESEASLQLPLFLEELRAYRCVRLKSLRGLAQATKLRSLDVSKCSELEELNMETLVSLEVLRVEECCKLKSILGSAQATKLRSLDVSWCDELEELPSMQTLVSLEVLRVEECYKLKSIRGLAQASKLRSLDVSGCYELEELPSMETIVSLEVLRVERCCKLKSIRGSAQATKLRSLNVYACANLEELSSMETFVSLEVLQVERCKKLKSIRGSAQATKLRSLNVSGCFELEEIPSMETLVSLEKLWAYQCVTLKSIRGLAQATKLSYLNVSGCSLEELSTKTLVSLEELWADRCYKLKSIRGLAQATKLRKLSVQSCLELEEAEGIEHCTWLEMRDVSGCPKLQSSGVGVVPNDSGLEWE